GALRLCRRARHGEIVTSGSASRGSVTFGTNSRRARTARAGLDLELPELSHEGRARDPEELARLAPVAAGPREGAADVLALDLLEGREAADLLGGGLGAGGPGVGRVDPAELEVLGADHGATRLDRGSRQRVAEL